MRVLKRICPGAILFGQLMRGDGEGGVMNPEELLANDRSPAPERKLIHEDCETSCFSWL